MVYEDCSVYYLVLPVQDQSRILVNFDESGKGSLPCVSTSDHIPCWRTHTSGLANDISAFVGSDVYIRRALWMRTVTDDDVIFREEGILVVDCMQDDVRDSLLRKGTPKSSTRTQWVSENEALSVDWISIHDSVKLAALLDSFFGEATGRIAKPKLRQPWREGVLWFFNLLNTVDRLLSCNQLERTSKLKQTRNSFQSTVLICQVKIIPSNRTEYLYVKCTIDIMPEALATKEVSKRLPYITPTVIAQEENLLLQMSCRGSHKLPSDESYLDTLLKMQFDSLSFVDYLKNFIPERGPSWIAHKLEEVFHDEGFEYCDKDTVKKLKEHESEMKASCLQLDDMKIPHTLVHRDLDPSNVFSNPVQFIDWASCCIGHPFVDYVRVTTCGWDIVENEQVKEDYLKRWMKFGESFENIKVAVQSARLSMMLHTLFEMIDLLNATSEDDDRNALKRYISNALPSILLEVMK